MEQKRKKQVSNMLGKRGLMIVVSSPPPIQNVAEPFAWQAMAD